MFRQGGKWGRGVAIGLVAGVASLLAWWPGWLEAWEAPTWTWRVRYFSRREAPSARIKLILLDQASLDWGRQVNGWGWPWPREAYGALAAFCARGGAAALALDLLFTEPSVYGVDDDEALGAALAGGAPTVLAAVPGGSCERWPEYLPRPAAQGLAWAGAETTRLLFPVAEIATGATAIGHVGGVPDADGVFRRLSLFQHFDGVAVPALGLAVWTTAEGATGTAELTGQRLRVGERTIPLDWRGTAVLRFKGRDGLPESYSAAAVIQAELRGRAGEPAPLAPEVFRDCLVLVGSSAPALLDLRPIPINPKCPGVALHAAVVDNLLADSFLAEPGRPTVAVAVVVAAILAALSLTFGSRWWQAAGLSAGWLALPVLTGFVAYARGWWWPVAVSETGVGLALVGALAANYWGEGRQKAFLKQAFRHYLSGEVIDKILRDPQHLRLGGEKRELTIMFTDLAGFSTVAEKLDAVELTTLLNEYLSEMSEIILAEGGTLDKYEGDAIIAFWNAPLEQADHAARACRAAARCQARLAERREGWERRTGVCLRMRVGLNTGEVVVGNMGSRQRFNYTILGDAANLASRLEGANKVFGTETMVAESTWRRAGDECVGRQVATIRVVGRQTPVTVYEMVGQRGEALPPGWASFATGLAHFTAGEFAAALAVFADLPDDPVAQRYAARCAWLLAQPPPKWDGVWDLTEK